MKTTITPIRVEHLTSFRTALDAVAREKKYLAMIEAPPMERMSTFVHDNIAKGYAQFVAIEDGEVIGWADVIPALTHGVSHRGCLGMGLLPPYRGRGIGRKLLEACIARSWEIGLTRIELEVRADNEHALRLYQRLGFVEEGRKRRGLRIEGEYKDTVQMALLRT